MCGVADGEAGAAGKVTAVTVVVVEAPVLMEFLARTPSTYSVPAVKPVKVYVSVLISVSVATTAAPLSTSTAVTGAAVVEVGADQVMVIVPLPTEEARPVIVAGVPSGVAVAVVERLPSPAVP